MLGEGRLNPAPGKEEKKIIVYFISLKWLKQANVLHCFTHFEPLRFLVIMEWQCASKI